MEATIGDIFFLIHYTEQMVEKLNIKYYLLLKKWFTEIMFAQRKIKLQDWYLSPVCLLNM